ncbi:MAG: glycosyltransferase family 4 protein [Verrucomicrobia bacterium]|nr:glycosyltransferase family 4 protein [Verrucomicrobiota bacterium]
MRGRRRKRPDVKPCVLIVVENLPVPPDRRVWQEARALRDAGYAVVIICPRMHGHNQPDETLEGIRIYRHRIHLQAKGFAGFFLEYASALWGETRLAWRAWWRHRFQVIHLCNPPDLLFLVAWPFKLLGVRVVYDTHDLWPEMFEAKFGRGGLARDAMYRAVRLAQRLTYACADVVLATNETHRRCALEQGRKRPEAVFIVRTAPKIVQAAAAANPALKRQRRFLVGYVGVMGSADGVHHLLEAAAHLVHRLERSDIQFLLLGSGPEFERLLAQRDALGLRDFVDMPGWAGDDVLFPALATIDLGVTCDPPNGYNHSCSMNKVLEYMAFGKPQVLFDLRECRAVAGEAARYVPGQSPTALAEAIATLLDDHSARQRMGEIGARRIRQELNWDRSVEQLCRAYARVLG